MAEHYVSAPVSGFHFSEITTVKLSHFSSHGPLLNGVTSWQLIIKHYLTHRFHGQRLSVLPNVPVPHHFGTGPLVEPGTICEWSRKVAIEYKT